MFDRFVVSFRFLPAGQVPGLLWADDRLLAVAGYRELAGTFAGCSFENGIYRLHDEGTGPRGEAWIAESFPRFASRACPFGYDWLGRQFAVDSQRLEGGEPLVLLFEPGTGEVLEIPFSFTRFHEQLDELREPALAESFFASWAQANPRLVPLSGAQCAGYKVPLFLGGKDALQNLEVIDLEVYWSLSGQLRQGTQNMPPGSWIGQVG
jgi:T6SS immunity protein Tdi1, C-terminal